MKEREIQTNRKRRKGKDKRGKQREKRNKEVHTIIINQKVTGRKREKQKKKVKGKGGNSERGKKVRQREI